ncbi:FAR1 domain-containing protein [Cephalotus follicularis]|uniref:FAR1 domain-containing protein n=1 Tax=Cephalotus follicularis TaxID=3775 RepID=A0A1Q3D414_CEPFO|nr:FAR1 domain-containing protein [Cephalotus follicularis]
MLDCNNVDKPCIGQEFDTLLDARKFYNWYVLRKGFGTRRSSSNKSYVGRVIWKRFVYDKQGFKKKYGREDVQRHRDTGVGCKAHMVVRLTKGKKRVVSIFLEEHNHDLDTPRRVVKHRSHNQSHKNPLASNLMDKFQGSGMGTSRIAKAINAKNWSNCITGKQVTEHLRQQLQNRVGREGVMVAMHFQ